MIAENKNNEDKQKGKVKNKGLRTLIEKSCWKIILNINVKKEGA